MPKPRLKRSMPALLLLTGLLGLSFFWQPGSAQSGSLPPAFPASVSVASPQSAPTDYFHLQKKIYRWNDQTRLVLVHISTPAHLAGWQPWHPQLIKDAFAEWQRALQNRIMFVFMPDTTQTDMVVNWWPLSTPTIERGAAGLNMMSTWGKYIAKNDLFISLNDQTGQPHSPGLLYATALHEIGHSLGIQGHSDQPADIMYFSVNEGSRLSQRDVNTLLKIYAAKPDFSNPPGFHLSRFSDFQKTRQKSGFRIPIIIPIPL
ncbi:matrixin family metalloprotease [Vampirovibrio chlorellavorus]|uniref:matrixin family metalloprotease n=1 Tax=Vampirovibrio chlorellavorus TaxID=758823 RepID=UPI0026F19CC7|nr:matrixin family metalloprotease [Vampirovibrio chlorellavorus]